MPRMPRMTSTMENANKTPHKLRLNFRLCSRLRLFCADHSEYVVWCPPIYALPSGGYFLEVLEWMDRLEDRMEAVFMACRGMVPPGWGTLAKLLLEANEMASSRSRSSARVWNQSKWKFFRIFPMIICSVFSFGQQKQQIKISQIFNCCLCQVFSIFAFISGLSFLIQLYPKLKKKD